MQAFIDKDEYKDGHISSIAFQEIMVLLKDHLLTDYVRENLIYVSTELECVVKVLLFTLYVDKGCPRHISIYS